MDALNVWMLWNSFTTHPNYFRGASYGSFDRVLTVRDHQTMKAGKIGPHRYYRRKREVSSFFNAVPDRETVLKEW